MALILHSDVVDNGLNEIVNEATTVFVCSNQPADYSQASSTYKLGSAPITFNAPEASAAGDGRKITSDPISGGSITSDGTVAYWAVCDGSRLLATDAIDAPEAVTNGWEFTLAALSLVLPFEETVTAPEFSIAYIDYDKSTADAAEYTFSAMDLGAEDAGRVMIAVVHLAGTAAYANAVTIGGVSATERASAHGTARACQIWSAAVPSGTSGDVVVGVTGTQSRCAVGLFRALNVTAFDDSDTDITVTNSAVSGVVTAVAGGAVLGGASFQQGVASMTWTNVTEIYDDTVEISQCTVGAGLATGAAGGDVTVTGTGIPEVTSASLAVITLH